MAKPTEEELQKALQIATRMRETDQDPYFLAKSLLNHNYRLGYLEEVLHAVERYLHSGLAEREHTLLVKAIQKAKAADERTAGGEHIDIGLS